MPIAALIKAHTGYREVSPGVLAGPCPACGGALRLRIGMEQRRFSCTHCPVAGDFSALACLLGLKLPAVAPSPSMEGSVREMVAHDGRRYHITDNRAAYDRLVASGAVVFDSAEIALVIKSGADRDQAARFLDAKATFPGIRITEVRPYVETSTERPQYQGKFDRSRDASGTGT